MVDTTGLLLTVAVHEANIQDRESVQLLREPIKGTFPRLEKCGWIRPIPAREGRGSQSRWDGRCRLLVMPGPVCAGAGLPKMRSSIGTGSFHRAFMSFPTDGSWSENLPGWVGIDG